eukprot:scaffold671340_cov53-Prasinocladus_malaysianus.AAC.1
MSISTPLFVNCPHSSPQSQQVPCDRLAYPQKYAFYTVALLQISSKMSHLFLNAAHYQLLHPHCRPLAKNETLLVRVAAEGLQSVNSTQKFS